MFESTGTKLTLDEKRGATEWLVSLWMDALMKYRFSECGANNEYIFILYIASLYLFRISFLYSIFILQCMFCS